MVMGRNVLCDSCGGGFEQVAACGCTQNLNESMFLCKHNDFRISKMFSNIEVSKNSSSKSHLQFLVKTNAADFCSILYLQKFEVISKFEDLFESLEKFEHVKTSSIPPE